VGCDLSRLDAAPGAERPDDPPLILWNHRWEYDKDPETFLRALYALDEAGMTFRVAIAGKNHHHSAAQLEAASQHLASHVVHFGYAKDETYAALLHRADVVVSTAVHEFFGVAVVEAIYSGCLPVLPDRLSYRELIPESAHEACIYRGYQDLVARLGWAVTHRQDARAVADELRDHVAQFDWAQMAPVYDRHLAEVA
jgi:glycosyltransferase involved in cell wall biosynthesis